MRAGGVPLTLECLDCTERPTEPTTGTVGGPFAQPPAPLLETPATPPPVVLPQAQPAEVSPFVAPSAATAGPMAQPEPPDTEGRSPMVPWWGWLLLAALLVGAASTGRSQ